MIVVGIDDTDTVDSPGTNQLAKAIVRAASGNWRCVRIVRHQLFFDPRVPYTSKNGSASITLDARTVCDTESLRSLCEDVMRAWYVDGSDPGLCIAEQVPADVTDFARLCQRDIVTQQAARQLAATHCIFLKGLGGTEGGVIGALAAVGLAVTGNDGRVVQHGEWPDDLSGPVPVDVLRQRGVDVIEASQSLLMTSGTVDVGKHLRANRRNGRTVLLVDVDQTLDVPHFRARKLT